MNNKNNNEIDTIKNKLISKIKGYRQNRNGLLSVSNALEDFQKAIKNLPTIQNKPKIICHTPRHSVFNFPSGASAAHQHINPNGELGGWVADTAYVEPNCYVGKDVLVYDKARVYGNVKLYDHALISGNSIIGDRVRIYDNALISGNSKISGDVCICGKSYVNDAILGGNVFLSGNAEVSGGAEIIEAPPLVIKISGIIRGPYRITRNTAPAYNDT